MCNDRQQRRIPVILRRVAFALVLIVQACGPSRRADSELSVNVDNSGSYPVVKSTGTAPQWTAESLFDLGTSDGGPTEFGAIRSILMGRTGSLYVVDSKNRIVSIFDSTGAFQRQLGRQGGGPAEYQNPYSLAWLGDYIALLDPGNVRLSVYDSAGRWVASWPVQPITGGQMIRLYRTPPTFWAYSLRNVGERRQGAFVRYTRTGPTDSIVVGLPQGGVAKTAVCNGPGKGISYFVAPFGSSHLVIPNSRGERAIATTSTYRITFVNEKGDTLRALERTAEPPAITDAEWEAATAEWNKFRRDYPSVPCDQSGFTRPATKPVLAFLFYDDVGQLWVEVATPEGSVYDVFDYTARLVASVHGLPPTGGIDPAVSGDRIAFVGEDSSDVPVVHVYRLTR